MRPKAVLSWSSESMVSLCSLSSGKPWQKARNLASGTTPPSPSSLKRSCGVLEAFFMCALIVSTACVRKMAGVRSSLSPVRGEAISVVTSSFFSSASIMSVASFSSRWATNLCSWSRSRPFCLSRSLWIFVSLSSILLISASIVESAATPLASRWRFSNRFRTLARMLCASACVEPAFSQAPFMASGATSVPPSTRAVVASVAVATFCCTSATFSDASRLTVEVFRSVIPFFVSLSCLATASSLVWCSARRSCVPLKEFSESLFAARRFIARKVLAEPTAVWAP
mmetsp:Transcript_117126/g.377983  ORF Transcript_117126/g.377983 Transcript_117126/m.377983 type:complete len:284 (-) Transcript_117126:2133-2984(-)